MIYTWAGLSLACSVLGLGLAGHVLCIYLFWHGKVVGFYRQVSSVAWVVHKLFWALTVLGMIWSSQVSASAVLVMYLTGHALCFA
jgi:hypothetical protein